MKLLDRRLEDCLVLEREVFADPRGWFYESFNQQDLGHVGIRDAFVQGNVSKSVGGTLRGLHFQQPKSQGKLISVIAGQIWDVAVDIRVGSPTFGQWAAVELSDSNNRSFWIPPGFAHGFVALSSEAVVSYFCTELYDRDFDRAIAWDDPDIAIDWPVKEVLLSTKDASAVRLRDMPKDLLPVYTGKM